MVEASVYVFDPTFVDTQSKVRGVGRYIDSLMEALGASGRRISDLSAVPPGAVLVNPFFNPLSPPFITRRITPHQVAVIHVIGATVRPAAVATGVSPNCGLRLVPDIRSGAGSAGSSARPATGASRATLPWSPPGRPCSRTSCGSRGRSGRDFGTLRSSSSSYASSPWSGTGGYSARLRGRTAAANSSAPATPDVPSVFRLTRQPGRTGTKGLAP